MRLLDGRKSFKIGFIYSLWYNTGCDGRTDGRTRCRSKDTAYYVARVKIWRRSGNGRALSRDVSPWPWP